MLHLKIEGVWTVLVRDLRAELEASFTEDGIPADPTTAAAQARVALEGAGLPVGPVPTNSAPRLAGILAGYLGQPAGSGDVSHENPVDLGGGAETEESGSNVEAGGSGGGDEVIEESSGGDDLENATEDLGSDDLGSDYLGSDYLGSDGLGAADLGSDDLGSDDLGSDGLGSGELGTETGTGTGGASDKEDATGPGADEMTPAQLVDEILMGTLSPRVVWLGVSIVFCCGS